MAALLGTPHVGGADPLLTFEENLGQAPSEVAFLGRAAGTTLFVTPDALVFSLGAERVPMRLGIGRATPAVAPRGEDLDPRLSSYFIGDDPMLWVRGARHFRRVVRPGIRPGVDLVLHARGGDLELDLEVSPCADLDGLAVRIEGAEEVSVREDDALVIEARGQSLVLGAPEVWEELPGERRPVRAAYALSRYEGEEPPHGRAAPPVWLVTLELGARDPALPLVIDPIVTSTFLGTASPEGIEAMAVDRWGNSYATGFTSGADFPTLNAYQDAPAAVGQITAFVTKLHSTGRRIVYSTYLGGTGTSWGRGIVVDAEGQAVIAGWSDADDFPRLSPLRPGNAGGADAFLARLGERGDTLLVSTLYGGSQEDKAQALAQDSAGRLYVVGVTRSSDLPLRAALDNSLGGTSDAFVMKLNATLSQLSYVTYLGGGGNDQALAIASGSDGSAYITGETFSSDFPKASALRPALSGTSDAFVTKLSPTGSALVYSTYLGGGGLDDAWGIAVDLAGQAHVCGRASAGFPLKGSLFPELGTQFLFATKLAADGQSVLYSTYLGSNVRGIAEDIAIDLEGNASISGWVAYFGDGFSSFPSRNPLQPAYGGGGSDAFFLRLDSTGAFFHNATFLGGADNEEAAAIAMGDFRQVYLGGLVYSAAYPTTLGAHDRTINGLNDAFITRLDAGAPADFPELLPLGVDTLVVLTPAAPMREFQVEVPPGLRLTLAASAQSLTDEVALYSQWSFRATPSLHDRRADARGRSSQRIIIPTTRVGRPHILVTTNVFSGPTSTVTVRADATDLALERHQPGTAAVGGILPASIRGGGFDASAVFELVSGGGARRVRANAITVVGPERVELEWDLRSATTGIYDLVVTRGGETATLAGVFQAVSAGSLALLGGDLDVPDTIRTGRFARLTVRYANAGALPLPAPYLWLSLPPGVEGMLEGESTPRAGGVSILGVNPGGVAGSLGPGAKGRVSVLLRSSQDGTHEVVLHALRAGVPLFINWPKEGAPSGFPVSSWNALRTPISGLLGSSWQDYERTLGRIATRLGQRGLSPQRLASVGRLYREVVLEAMAGAPRVAIAGRVVRGSLRDPLRKVLITAFEGGEAVASARTSASGEFVLECLDPGVAYDLEADGFAFGKTSVTPPLDGKDVLGLELEAATDNASRVEEATSICASYLLPGVPLAPPPEDLVPIASVEVTTVRGIDPNEKDGPEGEGPLRLIGRGDELLYTIRFENLATATGPAKDVYVQDDLDPDLDWTTFRPREAAVGGHVFSLDIPDEGGAVGLPEGYSSTRLEPDVRVGRYSAVDVTCAYHPTTQRVVWSFFTIDPNSLSRPPLFDPSGFLPPNRTPPEGEGWVSFTIRPKATLAEGSEVRNEGTIIFDDIPMATAPVTNVITLSSLALRPARNPRPADDTKTPVEASGLYLAWDPDPRAQAHDIVLWKDSDPFPSQPTRTGLRLPFHVPAKALLADTTYHWQVVSYAAGGRLAKGPEWSFKTATKPSGAPAAPQIVSPADGARDVGVTPTIRWTAAPGAVAYELTLWEDSAPPPVHPDAAGIFATSFLWTSPLVAGASYRLRVDSVNSSGKASSDVAQFTIDQPSNPGFQRGDANVDGVENLSDAVTVLGYLFLGAPRELACQKAADMNDDGKLDIADPSALLGYLFLGSTPRLPAPFQACGTDPTPDGLKCERFARCP